MSSVSGHRKSVITLVSTIVVLIGVRFADAQFISPTCTPPECNPKVIQNIPVTDPAQTADFNITGDGGIGSEIQIGTQAPVLSVGTQNLIYGNVSGSSTAGSLMLLQVGGADRFRLGLDGLVTLSGDLDVGGTITGDGSGLTGLVETDTLDDVVQRGSSTTGTITADGYVAGSDGTNADPAYTFSSNSNTGMLLASSGVLRFVTNGSQQLVLDGNTNRSTVYGATASIPGNLGVNGGSPSGSWGISVNSDAGGGGIYAQANVAGTTAVYGRANLDSNVGVKGEGAGTNSYGVWGEARGAGSIGVYGWQVGGDYAMYSDGDMYVDGDLTVTGSFIGSGIPSASGTTNTLAKFTGASSLGDSIVSESGSTATVTGSLDVTNTLDVTGAAYSAGFFGTGFNYGGRFEATNTGGGIGAYGFAPNTGVRGEFTSTSSPGKYGVIGVAANGAQQISAGVAGFGGDVSVGVYAVAQTGTGVRASATSGLAGYFSKTSGSGTTVLIGSGGATGLDVTGSSLAIDATGDIQINGVSVCRQNGTNCPTVTVDSFRTMNVPAGTDPVADSSTDTLNWTAGSGISISGNSTTDTITITNTGDTNGSDDLTGLNAGSGISISGSAPTLTVTNTGDTNAADDITGSGSTNYVPRFTGTRTLGNSSIYNSGSNVGIGTTAPEELLHVSGGNLELDGALKVEGTGAVNYVCNGVCGVVNWAGAGDLYVEQDLEVDGNLYPQYLVWAGSPGSYTDSDRWLRNPSYVELKPGGSSYGLVLRDTNSTSYVNLEANDGYGSVGYNTSGGAIFWDTSEQVGIGTAPSSSAKLYVYPNGQSYGVSVYGNTTTYGFRTSYPTYGYYGYSSSYSFMGYSNGTPFYGYSYCSGSGCQAAYLYSYGITTRLSYYNGRYYGVYSNGGAYFADDVGIGTAPARKLHVYASYSNSGTGVMRVDHGSYDGDMIEFVQGGVEEGRIRISGSTVSYQGFTGSHMADTDREDYAPGLLMTLKGTYRRNSDHEMSEPIYDVTIATEPNDDRVLGALLSNEIHDADTNGGFAPADIMAVGNGDIWVVDTGEDLKPGDYLITSDMPGHAMKDPGTYDVSHVIGRVGTPVDWDAVDARQDGRKHALVSVFFEPFERVNVKRYEVRIDGLEAEVVAKDKEQDARIDELERRIDELEALLRR